MHTSGNILEMFQDSDIINRHDMWLIEWHRFWWPWVQYLMCDLFAIAKFFVLYSVIVNHVLLSSFVEKIAWFSVCTDVFWRRRIWHSKKVNLWKIIFIEVICLNYYRSCYHSEIIYGWSRKNRTKFGTPYILCHSTCYQALYITLFVHVFLFECHMDF